MATSTTIFAIIGDNGPKTGVNVLDNKLVILVKNFPPFGQIFANAFTATGIISPNLDNPVPTTLHILVIALPATLPTLLTTVPKALNPPTTKSKNPILLTPYYY